MIAEEHAGRSISELLELGYSEEEVVEQLLDVGLPRATVETAVAAAALERAGGEKIVEI